MDSRDEGGQHLRLLTFNIQAGTSTTRYRHYLTRSWRQALPHSDRARNLDAISDLVSSYDLVGLQEVDSGSLRSGFINQTKYLANHAGFPYWCHQPTRKVGSIAYAGNGLLSRFRPDEVIDHRLPGVIPGRGALWVRFGEGDQALILVILHLALGRRARLSQLDYAADHIRDCPHAVILGDLNTPAGSPELKRFSNYLSLQIPSHDSLSYPSWQPQRAIDHVLLSGGISVKACRVLDVDYSDHCPVSVEVQLPLSLG